MNKVYRPYFVVSIITTVLSICMILGLKWRVPIFNTDVFYTVVGIYYLFSFVSMLILLLRDWKKIWSKGLRFKNISLFVLTTPLTLLLFLLVAVFVKNLSQNIRTYKYLSDYNLCPKCLNDGQLVNIIYNSGGPNLNKDYEFYYHYIVVDEIKEDTFNILTTAKVYFDSNSRKRNYLSRTSDMSLLLQNFTQLMDTSKKVNISDLKPKEINKVVFDPDLERIENNKFPTLIGELGYIEDLKDSTSFNNLK